MFTLLRGLYDEATHVPERRVVLLGTGGAGKTALLECAKRAAGGEGAALPAERLSRLAPTVGLNVARLPGERQRLLVWDLGGAAALRPIWERYVGGAEALVWVFDAAAGREGAEESREALRALLRREPLKSAPLLVFATKQDVDGAVDPVKCSLALDLLSDAEERPQCVQPCSAKTGEGVVEGLQWLSERLLNPSEGVIRTSIKSA